MATTHEIKNILNEAGEADGSYRDEMAFSEIESGVQLLGKAMSSRVWAYKGGFALEQGFGGRVSIWVDCKRGTKAKLLKALGA